MWESEREPDHPLNGKYLPSPWVNGAYPDSNEWITFRTWVPGDANEQDDLDETRFYYTERRCAVCGERLGEEFVYLLSVGHTTSGPGCHPVCATLALKFCPHLVSAEDFDPGGEIGWLWSGELTQTEDDWMVPRHTPTVTAADIHTLARRQAAGDPVFAFSDLP